MKVNKCPKCGSYILGEHCYTCKIDIRNYLMDEEENNTLKHLKDILGINDE